MHPADGLAEIEIGNFPMGRQLLCTLRPTRSNPNLRHYFACLQALGEATGAGDKDSLHEWLKLENGLAKPVRLASGETRWVADSVAFDRLKHEASFIDYKRRAFEHCHAAFGVDPTTLNREGSVLLGRSSL